MAQIPFFSIIIPVYNGLTHDLPVCLNSIWNQSLDKELYEVICVDDCSMDGTRLWLKEQCQEHSNLRIVENEINIRQGGARNRGVEVAKGKYILFIDQDDYYHNNSISAVYNILKEGKLDVLICDSAYQLKGYPHNELQLNLSHLHLCSGIDYILHNGIPVSPWRFCINRTFYTNNNCEFMEDRRCEDADWCIRLLFYATTVQYKPILLIHHNKTGVNETDLSFKSAEGPTDYIFAGNTIIEIVNTFYKKYNAKDVVIKFAETYYYRSCVYLLTTILPISCKKTIIKDIAIKKAKNKLVYYATKYPTLYSVLSNCIAPVFKFIAKEKQNRTINKLKKMHRNEN